MIETSGMGQAVANATILDSAAFKIQPLVRISGSAGVSPTQGGTSVDGQLAVQGFVNPPQRSRKDSALD
jgi:hypothetical protein